MTRPLFVDSNVILYALGSPSEHRDACAELLRAAGDARCALHLSVEAVQEVVFHRMRRVPAAEAVAAGRRLADASTVYPFDEDVLRRALMLIETCEIRGRDAVHAATAMAHGFDSVVTTDQAFSTVPGFKVVAPAVAVSLL